MKNVTPKSKKSRRKSTTISGKDGFSALAEEIMHPTPPPAKAGGFWDDEDDVPAEAKPVQHIIHTNIPDVEVAAKKERQAPAPIKALPVSAPCPEGFFSLQCGEDRVLIIRPISSGSDWSELLCYHHQMRRTMHLKRVDLLPKQHVDAAITFLQSVK